MRFTPGMLGLAAAVGCGGPPAAPPGPPAPRLVWAFEAPHPGGAVAAPLVADGGVFVAVAHARGFDRSGAVYALHAATGRVRWAFDADGAMRPTASAPLLAGGRLVVGEGMHADFVCRLRALDPATGAARWAVPTGDHVEGGAAVADGTVVFAAGNDGVYAADAATGAVRWNFRADLHIDTTPCVAGGRVYAGSGTSRRFRDTRVVCLDAATGNPVWQAPVPLPAWGAPAVAAGRVYVGLGNGRLNRSDAAPAGGLACLDAATGAELWTVRAGDAVFGRPAVVGDRVVVGSRDGRVYGVAADGAVAFTAPAGGPVVGGPAVVGGRVYVVSVAGRVTCLDAATGREDWRHELVPAGRAAQVYAPPVAAGGRLYVAAEVALAESPVATVFCLELPD